MLFFMALWPITRWWKGRRMNFELKMQIRLRRVEFEHNIILFSGRVVFCKKYYFFYDLKPKPSEQWQIEILPILQAWNDGRHIRIFGHGTLSGDFIPHPNYADPPVRGICISNSDLNNPVILRVGWGSKSWIKMSDRKIHCSRSLSWGELLANYPRNTLKSFLLLNLFLECLDDLWLISRWITMRSSPSTQ